jgi:competence protein ComEC
LALMAGFVLGCAVQLQQVALFSGVFYVPFTLAAFCLIAGAAIKYRASDEPKLNANSFINRSTAHAGWRMLATAILAGSLGFGITGLRAVAFQSNALQPSLEGPDVQVVGVVAAMPQRSEAGLRFRLEVESAQSAGRPVTLPPGIYLSWYSGLLRAEDPASVPFAELQQGLGDLRAGERWAFTVRLKAPHGNANPHGFDYELWLWEQGLQATGYVRATPKDAANGGAPRKLGSTWQHPVERARQHVRDAIFARLAEPGPFGLALEPRLAGVIAALVVGDQAAIERADWDVYRATGVAHLMSISGLHVTMFAWAAALCVGWMWRRSSRAMLWLPAQHAALVGGVLLAALYALFSGWGVPSQRTIWMLATVALLRLSGKQWPWPLVWLLAMAVVVALDPWALLQAGFWLSFVAVGVLFATDGRGSGVVNAQDGPSAGVSAWARLRAHPAAQKFIAAAREQWVITLALTPLSLLLFQQVSVVGLLANALAIPWVTLVVTPLAMLGVLFSPAWTAAAVCVQVLGVVLAWFASWPLATISVAAPALSLGAIAVIGAILLAMQLPWTLRAMGAAMVLPVLLWQPPRPASGQFELLAADIGQGNAVLVRTATRSLLYDTGPRFSRESDAGQRTLVPLLRALGEKLDTVVLSHRDSDHTGGAAAILAMQPQAALLSSLEDGHELLGLRPTAQRCIAGQTWQWDGVAFEVLHPQAADYDAPNKSNAMSCVLRISNGQHTALLVGDIEAAQESRLVQTYADAANAMHTETLMGTSTSSVRTGSAENTKGTAKTLQADLLLVPHHGSKTSSTPEFLDAVHPRIAIGQSGYRNRFNHPAPEVAQRYIERNIQLITSPRCGAATWRSDQAQTVVCQREKNKRYWHHQIP